jgi:hypothetical protein
MSRARGRTDVQEFAAFTRRILRAYGRRAAAGELDPADLAELVELRRELDEATGSAVASMKAAGYSWADIGNALGMTRQAAQQRWTIDTQAGYSSILCQPLVDTVSDGKCPG